MASGKLSPRQKMINMMYLVLIALLALNVSKEILNAFTIVGQSLDNSNKGLQSKNTSVVGAISSKQSEAANGAEILKLARETQKLSKELYDYLEKTKQEIITGAGGKHFDEEHGFDQIKGNDNIDVGTHLLVDKGEAEVMEKKIEECRKKMLDIVKKGSASPEKADANYKKFEKELPLRIIPPPKGKEWGHFNFHHVPAVADEVMISKFQNDVLNSEASILEFLAAQIGAKDIKFDQLAARVIAPKSYLLSGKEYTAEIFLSASSSTVENEVYMGQVDWSKFQKDSVYKTKTAGDIPLVSGDKQPMSKTDNKALYKTTASGIGEQRISGVIMIKNTGTGEYEYYPWETSYEVAPPSGFTVTADKMNVFYIGVDNPVTISVGGAADNAVSAGITGGTITSKGGGKYNVRVTTPGKAMINVSAKIDGEQKSFPPYEYRVKRIPDPYATLGGKLKGGKVQKATLAAQMGIVPVLENFDFDCKFDVVKYEMMYSKSGDIFRKSGAGPIVTADMKSLINGARAKDLILFNDIVVRGPDGQPRNIGSMVFEII